MNLMRSVSRVALGSMFLAVVSLAGVVYSEGLLESEAEQEFARTQESLDTGKVSVSRTIRRYRRLIRLYSKTSVAAKAQHTIGGLYEKVDDLGEASAAYMLVLDNYRESEWFEPAAGDLYRIASYLFLKAEKEAVLTDIYSKPKKVIKKLEKLLANTYGLPGMIFAKLAEVIPHSEHAIKIQYKAGVCSMNLGDYDAAASYFQEIIREHKQEPWSGNAMYQVGMCYFRQSLSAERDQTMTDKAIEQFLRFKEKYPGSKFVKDADEKVSILREKKADSLYLTCLFYWKKKDKDAYSVYLQKLITDHPNSEWTQMAKELAEEEG